MRGGYSFVACDYCVSRGVFRCMHPMSMHVSRVASLFRLYNSLPNKASEAIAGLPWPAAGQLSGTPGSRTHFLVVAVRPERAVVHHGQQFHCAHRCRVKGPQHHQ